MIVSNATAQGCRPYQEDYHAFYAAPAGMSQRGTLLLLADGMGGLAGGSTASFMAVEHFKNAYYKAPLGLSAGADLPEILARIMPTANEQLLAASRSDKNLSGMGTTLIAAVVAGNQLYWTSVGDSHLYLLREGQLRLLNEDHSIGGQLKQKLSSGEITPEQAKAFDGQHHKLVHYLGNKNFTHFDLSRQPVELLPDDLVVMCSDGLYGTLSEVEIAEMLTRAKPEVCANELVQQALDKQAPGQDNVTVQVVSSGGGWQLQSPEGPNGQAAAKRRGRLGLALAIALLALFAGAGAYWYRSKLQPPRVAPAASAAAQGAQASARNATQDGPVAAPHTPNEAKPRTEPAVVKPAPLSPGAPTKGADKGPAAGPSAAPAVGAAAGQAATGKAAGL